MPQEYQKVRSYVGSKARPKHHQKHQQGIEGLFNYVIKIKNLEDVSLDFLKAEIIKLEKDGRVVYKKFNGIDSFYRC